MKKRKQTILPYTINIAEEKDTIKQLPLFVKNTNNCLQNNLNPLLQIPDPFWNIKKKRIILLLILFLTVIYCIHIFFHDDDKDEKCFVKYTFESIIPINQSEYTKKYRSMLTKKEFECLSHKLNRLEWERKKRNENILCAFHYGIWENICVSSHANASRMIDMKSLPLLDSEKSIMKEKKGGDGIGM